MLSDHEAELAPDERGGQHLVVFLDLDPRAHPDRSENLLEHLAHIGCLAVSPSTAGFGSGAAAAGSSTLATTRAGA